MNNNFGIMRNSQQPMNFNSPLNGQQMNVGSGQMSSNLNAPMNGQQMNGTPMSGQSGSAFTFVKMSVYTTMNCQSMVVNSSSIESGKCYTYCKLHKFAHELADMCRLNKFSKQFCDQLPGNTKFSSFKFQCMSNGVQGNYFSDSKCATSTSIPVNANSGTCNQGKMYTCSAIEEQTIVNGTTNPSFIYNDAKSLDAFLSLVVIGLYSVF